MRQLTAMANFSASAYEKKSDFTDSFEAVIIIAVTLTLEGF